MTTSHNAQISDRDAVALADGSLSARRQARAERAMARSPRLAASVDAQRRALAAISKAAMEPAPAALRARLELARDPRESRRLPRPRIVLSGGLAAAALSLLVALLIGIGSSAAPTVASASALGARGPTVALEATGDRGNLPGVSAAGIAFPDWARFGFKAVGVRRDPLGGRVATTVFYRRPGDRIAYTIVSGAPLSTGATAHERVWDGTRLASLSVRGRVVVTWLRDGHTCVLSATRTPTTVLALLASANADPSTY